MMKEKPNERKDFSMIGKLMAAENINVRYDYTETAYFDLESRNLVLPIYDGLSRDVYEMMLAHEVSHALNTDESAWKEYIGNDSNKHQYANIVEDARIEKLIRRRYPGVTRYFRSGYKELHEKNFFGLEDGEDLSERVLIDRLNLHFKSYGNLEVPFTAEEAKWVTRINAAETWSDVTEIVDELYDSEKEKQQEQDSQEPKENTENTEEAEETEETTSAGNTEDSEGEDTEDSESDSEDTEETTEETEGEDDSRSTSDNAENTSASEGIDDESDNEAENEDAEAPTAKSMEDFENKLKENAKDNTGNYIASVTLRDEVLDTKWKELLVPAKDFVAHYRKVTAYDYGQFDETKIVEQYRTLNKANAKTINHMLKEFDMKKAANVAKRTMTSKTGDLDLDKLYNYKTSDDIFLKHESVPDGKNHGVVMLIDFSGSMSGTRIWNSLLQVFNMVAFANKAGIPYRVYGFTDHFRAADSETVTLNENGSGGTSTYDSMTYGPYTNMKLIEIINSNLSKKDWLFAMGLIAGSASLATVEPRDSYLNRRRYFDFTQGILGSTPLNIALYVMPKIIKAFQSENHVDKTIFMLYTDGGASDGFSTYRSVDFYGNSVDLYGDGERVLSMNIDRAEKYYEPTIRKFYSAYDIRSPYEGNTQGVLTQRIKDLTNAKILGYNIVGKDYRTLIGINYRLSGKYEDYEPLKKFYRSNGFWTVNNAYGYDFYSMINGNTSVSDASLESEIKGDISEVSTQKLAGAFKRANSKARDSRFLTKKLMEVIG